MAAHAFRAQCRARRHHFRRGGRGEIPISADSDQAALAAGADDYLEKATLTGARLERSIRYAIGRRRDERKFATMFANSLAAMVITDPASGQILDANPMFAALTGYTIDELVGQIVDLGIWASPELRDRFVGQVLEGKRSQLEATIRRKSGESRIVLAEVQLLEGLGTARPQLLGIITDLTGVRMLEEQFRQSQKMDAIGRLAGGIAHDFNNLLTAILGYGEQLESRPDLSAEASDDVAEILNAGRSAAALTRQLLAFSRQSMLEPRVIDVNALIGRLEGMLRRVLREDIELRTTLEDGLLAIVADPGQIEQIIVNLAVNARDAMPTGGSLTLETRNVVLDDASVGAYPGTTPGPHVALVVTDSGIGMDEAVKARLFEPFFTTKEHGKGTGLGLATVYGAVTQSGGAISVHSLPGMGTAFTILLPARGEIAEVEQTTAAGVSTGGTETLLLVEDQAEVLQLAQAVLARKGYTVHLAGDPREALEMVSRIGDHVHLLVTDVVMPHMSGRELARRCHERAPQMRVLYMSGYTADHIVHHRVLEDGVAFLQKPFSARALLEKVRSVLDSVAAPRI